MCNVLCTRKQTTHSTKPDTAARHDTRKHTARHTQKSTGTNTHEIVALRATLPCPPLFPPQLEAAVELLPKRGEREKRSDGQSRAMDGVPGVGGVSGGSGGRSGSREREREAGIQKAMGDDRQTKSDGRNAGCGWREWRKWKKDRLENFSV